ncbi:S-layer homology domain-containing protein [Cohnella rhizosphaerae]|uniref:S-layer homology domain-containing protein n=1 Tax=Cohnella rhizosphaerae TaxID=1457232 RepID=UPI003B8A81D1
MSLITGRRPTPKGEAFKDQDKISAWAAASVGKARQAKLMQGRSSDTFAPQGTATREETAQMIANLIN